jgi:hypothetical protein
MYDSHALIKDLPPVVINGYKLKLGKKYGTVWVERNGKKCTHSYSYKLPIGDLEKYELTMREVLDDFMSAADMGLLSFNEYYKVWGDGLPLTEAKGLWKSCRGTYKKLQRLSK